MSQENVEQLRRAGEAFNRGDIEGALAIIDPPPEFEFVPAGVFIAPGIGDVHGVQHGPEELRRGLEFWDQFDEPRFDVHELIDAGDQVVAWATLRGRGKQSGAEVGWDVWAVWTVREGRFVRWETFPDRHAALEAAGLEE
jgi:ketosteroid isomerase-like protein